MAIVKAVCLFLLLGSAYAKDGLFKVCKIRDFSCMKEITEAFYETSGAGQPEYGLKPTDPIHIDIVKSPGVKNVMVHFKNITITGLKHMKLAEFVMDTKAKTVLVIITANLNMQSDIDIEFLEASKTFSGTCTAKASTRQVVNHKYDIITDDKGLEYLALRDEEVDCETVTDPEVKISDDLQNKLDTDPDTSKRNDEYNLQKAELAERHVCEIVKVALKTYIDNVNHYFRIVPVRDILSDATS